MKKSGRRLLAGSALGIGLATLVFIWPILEGKTIAGVSFLTDRIQRDVADLAGSSNSGGRAIPDEWEPIYRSSREVIRAYLQLGGDKKRFIVIRTLTMSELDREAETDWSDLRNWPFERYVHVLALHDELAQEGQGVDSLYDVDSEARIVLASFFKLLETGRTDPGFREGLMTFNDANRKAADYSP